MPLSTKFQLYHGGQFYHIILYTSPRSRFELTTSVVIGTDCKGSCKSNSHTITAPWYWILILLFTWLNLVCMVIGYCKSNMATNLKFIRNLYLNISLVFGNKHWLKIYLGVIFEKPVLLFLYECAVLVMSTGPHAKEQ